MVVDIGVTLMQPLHRQYCMLVIYPTPDPTLDVGWVIIRSVGIGGASMIWVCRRPASPPPFTLFTAG